MAPFHAVRLATAIYQHYCVSLDACSHHDSVTNLFVTGAHDRENTRDRENACDQVAPTSHMTMGTHVTYHVTSGPPGYHVTYHVTHHVTYHMTHLT